MNEKEKFENEWQRKRKIMKREFMRMMQSYEEEVSQYVR
jgi:cytochrome P450